MVEPRIVVPDVAGSNPVGHPLLNSRDLGKNLLEKTPKRLSQR